MLKTGIEWSWAVGKGQQGLYKMTKSKNLIRNSPQNKH